MAIHSVEYGIMNLEKKNVNTAGLNFYACTVFFFFFNIYLFFYTFVALFN